MQQKYSSGIYSKNYFLGWLGPISINRNFWCDLCQWTFCNSSGWWVLTPAKLPCAVCGFAGVEGQILARSSSNTDGGFLGSSFPCAVVVSYPGCLCLSNYNCSIRCRKIGPRDGLSPCFLFFVLNRKSKHSLFSSLEFPVHLGTQHLFTIVLFSKWITENVLL